MKYYRSIWTCGRYDAESNSAIMYNLIAGCSFFFEDRSAKVIGSLLQSPRGEVLDTSLVSEENQIAIESINAFFEQLREYGLVSLTKTDKISAGQYRMRLQSDDKKTIELETRGMPMPISDVEKAYTERVKKRASVVMIELTYNCSEQCVHCYNPGATRNNKERSGRGERCSLSLEQYKRIIDELYEEGTFLVCLTGGDPFSNPYAWEIIDYLYTKEIAFEIFTNGQSLVGHEERLANYFPCYVAVSVYSAVEKDHDSITRKAGSLARSLSVLQKLHSLHVPLILKCVIMKNNVKTYRSVAELGKQLNAEVQFDCRLFDSSDGDKCVSRFLRLTPEQLMIAFRDKDSLYYVGPDAMDYGAIKHKLNEPACLAGLYSLCITPEGMVIPCCSYHAVLGDAKKQSIHEIIYGSNLLDRLTSLNLIEYEECGRYEYCDFCILCPGLNFGEHGNPRKAAENNCYYAKIRYKLYADLLKRKDPLEGKDIETALKELPDVVASDLQRVKSESHYNKTMSFEKP